MPGRTSKRATRKRGGSTKKASDRVSKPNKSRKTAQVAKSTRGVSKSNSRQQKQKVIGQTHAITRSQSKLAQTKLEQTHGNDEPGNHEQVTGASPQSLTRTLNLSVLHQSQVQNGTSLENAETQVIGAEDTQNDFLSTSASATVQSLSAAPLAQGILNSAWSPATAQTSFASTSTFNTSTIEPDNAYILCRDASISYGGGGGGDASIPYDGGGGGDASIPYGGGGGGDASIPYGGGGDAPVQSQAAPGYGFSPAQYINGRNEPPVHPAQGISFLASSTLPSQDAAFFSQETISFSATSTVLVQAPSASIPASGTISAQYPDPSAQPTVDQVEGVALPPSSTSPVQPTVSPAQSPFSPAQPTAGPSQTNFCDLPKHRTLAEYQAECRLLGESDFDISELPEGQPPAWATSRSNLADAIRWFRVVQGSTQHNDGVCHGVFLGSHGGVRPYMDHEIVITRTGGFYATSSSGESVLTQKQPMNKSPARELINNMKQDKAVGLIVGHDNDQLKNKPPEDHKFNIMAFFRITDVWYEMINGFPGLKVRFEKVDLSSKSWWAPKGTPPPPTDAERDWEIKPDHFVCKSCGKQSDVIFKEGEICLNAECKRFWYLGKKLAKENVTYHPKFLKKRTKVASVKCPFPLVPDLIKTLDKGQAFGNTYRDNWKGVVCQVCRKCLSRIYWKGWKCDGEACTWQYLADLAPVSLESVIGPGMPNSQEPRVDAGEYCTSTVLRSEDLTSTPYCKVTYSIPGIGSVFHYASGPAINARPGGPNDLFGALQTDDLDLRRYTLQSSVVAGTLTAHFAVNYGMPYKYVVKVASKGFDEASDAVRRSLGRLSWATKNAVTGVGKSYSAPNELLLLGYFQGMKIGYHDDGEDTLGPTIATLSLGAGSVMKIRMKDKYFRGARTENSLLDDDPVLPGCLNEEERRKLKCQFDSEQISKAEYQNKQRELFKKTRKREAAPDIVMKLNHGDLVVMDNAALQKYYEHSVIPDNKLRFALTARFITDTKGDFTEAEHRKGQFTLSPAETYHGD
ncbi:hypothetical protein N7493_008352 [Penicillium malachiteum]|uniref:Fe2OG dioxygenase domain-containing protein n=1 Tax=Penicillium malachiteum TaxID=1324776 RepID=A0AAD6MTP5_9EURO|nr:hypothetical protein N7493_008352 [Penicillium malachiteum]